MKKQPTQTAYDLRLAAEAKARKAQPKTSLKSQLIAAAIVVPLATAAALVTWFDAPATTTAGAADQRAKVSQATPSELVQPAP
jgi:hypothetical protein